MDQTKLTWDVYSLSERSSMLYSTRFDLDLDSQHRFQPRSWPCAPKKPPKRRGPKWHISDISERITWIPVINNPSCWWPSGWRAARRFDRSRCFCFDRVTGAIPVRGYVYAVMYAVANVYLALPAAFNFLAPRTAHHFCPSWTASHWTASLKTSASHCLALDCFPKNFFKQSAVRKKPRNAMPLETRFSELIVTKLMS